MIPYLLLLFCFFTKELYTLPWLKTHEEKFITEQGQEIQLRGINLGGWLVEEMWMMSLKTQPPLQSSFSQISDHVSLWGVLSSRFSPKEVEEIRTAFRSSWLEEKDFIRIRQAGFNCVRLPFIYTLAQEPKGLFYWLDYAIDAAEKQGLYVILDMHGAPGGQSKDSHSGIEGLNWFFSDLEMVEKASSIWTMIAKRYKDRSCIAGFDLLNEPSGANNTATLYLVQDRLYRAIREWDKKHILIIEDGFKGVDRIPNIAVTGWQNIAISTHLYAHHHKSEDEMKEEFNKHFEQFSLCQKDHKVPIYIGEFNQVRFTTADNFKKFLSEMNQRNFSWSFWTYKVAGRQHPSTTSWGLYVGEDAPSIDPFQDSKEEILKKMKKLNTNYFRENRFLLPLFQE